MPLPGPKIPSNSQAANVSPHFFLAGLDTCGLCELSLSLVCSIDVDKGNSASSEATLADQF